MMLIQRLCISFYLSIYLSSFIYLSIYIYIDMCILQTMCRSCCIWALHPLGSRQTLGSQRSQINGTRHQPAPSVMLNQPFCLIPSFSYKYADQYFSIICSHIKRYTFLIWSSTGKGSRNKQHNPTVRHFRSSLAGLANAEGSSSGTGRPLRRLAVSLAVALNFHNDMVYKLVFTRVFFLKYNFDDDDDNDDDDCSYHYFASRSSSSICQINRSTYVR